MAGSLSHSRPDPPHTLLKGESRGCHWQSWVPEHRSLSSRFAPLFCFSCHRRITNLDLSAGTGLGIVVSAWAGSSFAGVMLAYFPFAILSLWALQMSNLSVTMRTLNDQRADLLLQAYLSEWEQTSRLSLRELIGFRPSLSFFLSSVFCTLNLVLLCCRREGPFLVSLRAASGSFPQCCL